MTGTRLVLFLCFASFLVFLSSKTGFVLDVVFGLLFSSADRESVPELWFRTVHTTTFLQSRLCVSCKILFSTLSAFSTV